MVAQTKSEEKQTESADMHCILFRAEQVEAILCQDTICFALIALLVYQLTILKHSYQCVCSFKKS